MEYNTSTTVKFPSVFNAGTGKSEYVDDIESINECIGLLLRSSKGELLGDPTYGCNLMRYIFEPNDLILQDLVKEDIINAIRLYESRVYITGDMINVSGEDNKVTISIQYYIKSTGTTGSYELQMLKGSEV